MSRTFLNAIGRFNKRARSAGLCAVSAGLLGAGYVNAATIVSDGFTDGGRTDGTDAADINWWALSTTSTTLSIASDATAVTNGDNSLKTVLAGSYRGVVGNFTEQTLNVGDSITLAFDLRLVSVSASTSAGLRVGLCDTSTPYTANGNELNDNHAGYLFRAPAGGSGSLSTAKELTNDGKTILGGLGIVSTSDSSGVSITAGNVYNVVMTLTRTDTNTVTTASAIYASGSTTALGTSTGTDTAGQYAFNEIVIGTGGETAATYSVDNVSVTTVPEPASLAMLAIGGAALRRRRRS